MVVCKLFVYICENIKSMVKKKVDTTTMVRVDKTIHKKVKSKVKNSRESIGEFYDKAAEDKLKQSKNKQL